MANSYQITQVTPTTYMNTRGQAVNGYLVFVYLPEFEETHELRLPNINENTVKTASDKLVEDRRKLAKLGAS